MAEVTSTSLYNADFVLWSEQTAQTLRRKDFDAVDWENLIEEIESLGRSERHALASQLTRVLMHLLKWEFQSERRSNSWRGSLVEGRIQIRRLLKSSPSLKNYLLDILAECYQDAVEQASAETGLPIKAFPAKCPYPLEAQILNLDFLPD